MPPPIASSSALGFTIFGSLAALTCVTRPKQVRFRYGSHLRRPRLRQPDRSDPRSFGYVSNEQLHGELLSVHKVSQAYPGAPKGAEGAKETKGFGPSGAVEAELAAVREARLALCAGVLEQRLAVAGLPEKAVAQVRGRFAGRTFEAAELDGETHPPYWPSK